MTAVSALLERPKSTVLGCTEPRIWTPPLRELTPETSYGFRVNRFARDTLRFPLDPWEEWLTVHAGELLPDGRPRFYIVVVLVSRQNGKSTVPVVLVPYWQFIERREMTLLMSTKLDAARKLWERSIKLVERGARRCDPDGEFLAGLIPTRRNGDFAWTRHTNGEQEAWTTEDAFSKITASNEDAGRSLSVDRLIADEARQLRDYVAWEAAEPTTSAIWDSQIWLLSNAGDWRSVVLNDHRAQALEFIRSEGREGDPRIGLFEWSAPDDAEPDDIDALAQANPALGRRIDPDRLLARARAAKRKGGAALIAFRTNYMCQGVSLDEPAFDMLAWRRPADEGGCFDPGDLSAVRNRVCVVLDVAADERHATLGAGARLDDGRVRVEVVHRWDGPRTLAQIRRELRPLLLKIKPKVFGWFPTSPAAALAAELKARKGRGATGWPPPGVVVDEIRGETSAVCMGFASLVTTGQVAHSGDPLLDDHMRGSGRLYSGTTWVIERQRQAVITGDDEGDDLEQLGHTTAAYACAGAAYMALTIAKPTTTRRLIAVD